MDAFETRMQFLQHLRRLTSAAQSITKVVVFLLKHSQPHQAQPTNHLPANPTTTTTGDPTTDKSSNATGSLTLSSLATTVTDANANPTTTTTTTTIAPTHEEADLWECIVEELGSERASINAKINIFYMLDSLLDHSLTANFPAWPAFIQRDLDKVLRFTVPTHLREGVLNRMSALQVLNSWKARRLLPATQLDPLIQSLENATFPSSSSSTTATATFSRNDIIRRIEDDRERHKRLRERIWVLNAGTGANTAAAPTGTDLEFERLWDGVPAVLDDNDLKAMELENVRCFGVA